VSWIVVFNPMFWRAVLESVWFVMRRPRRFGPLCEYYRLVNAGTAGLMFGRFADLHPDVAVKAAIAVRKQAAAAGFATDNACNHREWLQAQNTLWAAIDAGLIPASTMTGLVSGE